MARVLYFWVGAILTSFFGFFAAWTNGDRDENLSHTGLFWFSVAGTVIGSIFLLIAVIATAVVIGTKEGQSEQRS